MAKYVFDIKGAYFKENCLPSLNDLLHEAERHPLAYNRLKKDMEKVVQLSFRSQLGVNKPNTPCRFNMIFGEKKKGIKRDYDNVESAARKIINDALVKLGVIKDDNPAYLKQGSTKFIYTDSVFIRVEIEELEDGIE